MVTRVQYENNNEIGGFCKLTNAYCLLAVSAQSNFYSIFENELSSDIPVIQTSISGIRLIGRLVTGNKFGLLVPETTTDQELQHLRNSLPESIVIRRIEEKLSALGNIIACNDHVALVNPDIDKETEEIIADTLHVEVFRQSIANSSLPGSYTVLTNLGGLVTSSVSKGELEELATLLQLPLASGTVNRGSNVIGSGLVANDWTAFIGGDSTSIEIGVVNEILQMQSQVAPLLSGGTSIISKLT